MAELDGIGIAAVFAADAELDAGTGRIALLQAIFASWSTPVWLFEAKGFLFTISFSV